MVDHADLQGALGVDGVGGVDQLHGGAGAHDTGHALGAAEAGDDAQAHFGLAELGLLGSDADVAGQGHLAAAAQGEAVDRGDGGLLHQVHPQQDAVAQLTEGQALSHVHGGHLADVSAGDEGAASAGDDDHVDVVVVLHVVQSSFKLGKDGLIQGVQSLGAVHGDDRDVVLFGDLNKCHRDFLLFLVIQSKIPLYCKTSPDSILDFSPRDKANLFSVSPKK